MRDIQGIRCRRFAAVLLFMATTGMTASQCSEKVSGSGTTTTTTATTTSSGSSTTTTTAALRVKVEVAWETGFDRSTYADCSIPSTAADGTTLACTAAVPEGKLFYGTTYITIETGTGSLCPQLIFRPYFYQASTAAAFTPLGSTAVVDCSVAAAFAPPLTTSTLPAACFNGPATTLVSSFPTYTGLYVSPTTSTYSNTYTIASGNSLTKRTNRWVSNQLSSETNALRDRTVNRPTYTPGGDGYIANTLRDYSATCMKSWTEDRYSITLVITDVDTETGEDADNGTAGNNDFGDWNSTLPAIDPQP